MSALHEMHPLVPHHELMLRSKELLFMARPPDDFPVRRRPKNAGRASLMKG